MKHPYKLTWNRGKTVRTVTLNSDLLAALKAADELVVSFLVARVLMWLSKTAAPGKYILSASQHDELNKAGAMYYALHPRLSADAYQAVQLMFQGAAQKDVLDIEALLPILDKAVKHMREMA